MWQPFPLFLILTEGECWAIMAGLALMALDVLAGLMSAVLTGTFASTKMREGLGHKAMLILVIALAVAIQGFSGHVAELGWSVPLIVPVCAYIVVMEVSSILENVAKAYPGLADTALFRLFDRGDDEQK